MNPSIRSHSDTSKDREVVERGAGGRRRRGRAMHAVVECKTAIDRRTWRSRGLTTSWSMRNARREFSRGTRVEGRAHDTLDPLEYRHLGLGCVTVDDRKAYDVERMVIYARNALPGSLFVTCTNNGKSGAQMLGDSLYHIMTQQR